MGGIVVALLIAGAIALVLFFRSDTGQKVAGAIGKGVKMTLDAQKAPGAREITKAGCKQGMVMDVRDSMDAVRPFLPDAGDAEMSRMPFRNMVFCSVDFFGAPPSCDAVKDVYLGAVPRQSAPFMVSVQRAGESKARCSRIYDPDGLAIADYDAGSP